MSIKPSSDVSIKSSGGCGGAIGRDANLGAIVRTYIGKIRPRAQDELDWFQGQATLESALELAALATNRQGKRYHHQRRFRRSTLAQARHILLSNTVRIGKSETFDGLFRVVDGLLQSVPGIGELYVYDTALRIGAKLGLLPDQVYLHAGTRVGARELGLDTRATKLPMTLLPDEFRELAPWEIEDVLCIFKDELRSASRDARAGQYSG